ncbi:MAG: hypothetical protein A3H69_02880 [Candidatus Sungbacteria bacterium RIFCSPLOWO2_02_FULL_47_9]|uniref:Uncharacterized protein n=1 Tax=Candidatus Sungbacteria bacterium RIFCSPHIGHO2_01_FULL_47_32 TaxID=1802264 RepID=A0A1G2K5G6_9BACT|nr:MAG: hypothetical protein UX72_C0011G0018 [Parcubacteria group bacterium GW2011_GWA2_47_10]OGZ94625.1 MAG: hypothetical protein A2633_01245 [Candidatus Sungbacteria bacterium RIFCSPHIGHO2_01_FULL_47_32]OGZ98695.1 MAG: hypothetical protein A3D57_00205 [Candidatus Sungbacteria bacterium RIFCSPHIGHO2_02_FULL_46_12]OHA04845.1 MAG: hypothetical protein A3A28_05060 [Candidatus Sungbacteria bacterium RIFCSPLOWO2_01_FULL_47_32]OHA11677.1 MAG: hypothetical protein A3H69_02880 [Candidatus Sungbacteria
MIIIKRQVIIDFVYRQLFQASFKAISNILEYEREKSENRRMPREDGGHAWLKIPHYPVCPVRGLSRMFV